MKNMFIRDVLNERITGSEAVVLGWVKARRDLGRLVFLKICDSTGVIQVVATNDRTPVHPDQLVAVPRVPIDAAAPVVAADVTSLLSIAKSVPLESSVKVLGQLARGPQGLELHASSLEVIGEANRNFNPRPRSRVDIFDPNLADHLLRYRHLYLRNDRLAAVLRFRHHLMGAMHAWFRRKGFIEITAPILTPVPLYDDGTAMPLDVHGEKVFLTQCVGFYLESAVHAFERVYNIGPSFRGEETRGRRYLMEYWHCKAELAWVDRDDLVATVEELISDLVRFALRECREIGHTLGKRICADGLRIPFPQIRYAEAIQRLQHLGMPLEFGASLGAAEEEALSAQFASPFWVVGIPRTVEPFPYVVDPEDPRVTRTADLIATGGYGELLGIAEKTSDLRELDERMREKGKEGDPRYAWVRDLRQYGCVPHGGFGMGVERFIRWLLHIPHVRDTIPFPRIFRRQISP